MIVYAQSVYKQKNQNILRVTDLAWPLTAL